MPKIGPQSNQPFGASDSKWERGETRGGVQAAPIAIVGTSAAGLFAAGLLAKSGRQVEILEQNERLNPEARTLIVTRRMREMLGPAGESSIVNEIRQFELFTDGRSASVSLSSPDLIIERAALIRRLAQEACRAGAKLHLGRRFSRLRPEGDRIALEFEHAADARSEELTAGTVVGADGANSRVAESAGWPPQKTVPLIQALVPLPKDMSPDTVRVWFVPHETPYFYWLIPDSPTRGALGLIGESGRDARIHLERFLEKRELRPIGFQGAKIPAYTGWVPVEKRVGAGRVFLVGDAAGQVKVTTVGGIVTGFRGALGVAEKILKRGSNSELRSLRRELDLHLMLRRALHHFTQNEYSRLVDLLNDPARRSLAEYTRDEALKVLWHLCLSQPRLVLLGLRGLLTRGRQFGR